MVPRVELSLAYNYGTDQRDAEQAPTGAPRDTPSLQLVSNQHQLQLLHNPMETTGASHCVVTGTS